MAAFDTPQTSSPWLSRVFCGLLLVVAVLYVIGTSIAPALQPYLLKAAAGSGAMVIAGLLARLWADGRDCWCHPDYIGVLAFLLAPISLPLLIAAMVYSRWTPHGTFSRAIIVFLAAFLLSVGLTYKLLLGMCIVSADDPCVGLPDVPMHFIINESRLRLDKLTFTVNDLQDRPIGSKMFQLKRMPRCGSPGAPFSYDRTLQYRETPSTVALWADHMRYTKGYEQWDIYDCHNRVMYSIEEDQDHQVFLHSIKSIQQQWIIRDGTGAILAFATKRSAGPTEVQVYDYEHLPKASLLGRMKQSRLANLKTKLVVQVLDDSKVASYVYGFLAVLVKLEGNTQE